MKIYFTLVLIAVLFSNCKEDEFVPPLFGVKLVSIAAEYQGKDGTIYFDYDTAGLLTQVEERFDGDRLEYIYAVNRLQKILTYDLQGEIKNMDSVAYSANEQVEKLYRFYKDENDQLTKLYTYEYLYNNRGEISRLNYYYGPPGEITQYITFDWENGNITRAKEFNKNDHLLFETVLNYDHKRNFKRNNPYFLFDPLNTTENNEVKTEVTDHTGLYDSACHPCTLVYEYNSSGYPIRYNDHFITYE